MPIPPLKETNPPGIGWRWHTRDTTTRHWYRSQRIKQIPQGLRVSLCGKTHLAHNLHRPFYSGYRRCRECASILKIVEENRELPRPRVRPSRMQRQPNPKYRVR